MRSLDARPGSVLLPKFFGFLPLASHAQRFMVFPRLQPDDPWLLLRFRATGTVWTRPAIIPGKPCLESDAILGVRIGQPGNALLARRACHHLVIPVHDETSLVEACTVAGLSTGVIGYGADDGHAVLDYGKDSFQKFTHLGQHADNQRLSPVGLSVH